ncbi:MAG: VCBS repeat-containing protein [Saprospiraceae bacterium]|nr:VCBS repeat-containing protein [Saprospiraceae bacterium]
MKNRIVLLALSLVYFTIQAQEPVVLVGNASLLNPISGFNWNNCVVDMNNDQLDDVVRANENGLYIDFQQPNGSFSQVFFPMNFQNLPSWSICAGDLDNNGYNDLLFGDDGAVSFVNANADGTGYTEYAHPEFIFSQRSTMVDIDLDGHLDAFVCHDVDQSHPYRNDGTGNMVLDQSLIVTADRPGNYAAIWTDYDNDDDNDLYITKCRGGALPGDINRTNLLYRNNGDGTFTEVGAQAGVDDNAQSWSTVFEDFDNDGDFDAFIVNHDFNNRFFLNNGDGTFTDIITSTGIDPNPDANVWENASGDFNNDGWVDILSEQQKEFALNKGGLSFTKQDSPINSGGIGDLNNDGFLDVVSQNVIYLNAGNSFNWLKINTIGTQSNRNGIGARIELYGAWGRQIREVRSGQSFSPMSSLITHFGIGAATQVDSVVVKWPSGVRTVVANPPINMTLNLPEASCLLAQTQIIVNGETELCPGESVVLQVPMGDFTSIEWSNGATTASYTASEAGTFSAILTDAEGCISFTNAVQVTLAQEVVPVVLPQGDTRFCAGGAVVLNMEGGANPVWSTGEIGSSITVSAAGEYYVSTDAVCDDDPITSVSVLVEVLDNSPPVVLGANIAPGDSILLTATGENLTWYDAPVGGNVLGTGNSFQTPMLAQTTTYYVDANHNYPGEIQTGGKLDNTGPGGLPTTGSYNLFNVWEPFTLNKVTVYMPVTAPFGLRTVQLYNGNGELLQQATFDLMAGEHELELGFEVPVGENLSLRCLENGLFRNTAAANTFPYPIGNLGEITNDALGNEYYYYFYNWQVQKPSYDCISERVSVTVGVSAGGEVPSETTSVRISPNPVSDMAVVEIKGKADLLRVFDATGRELERQTLVGDETVKLRMGGYVAGIYLIAVETEHGSNLQRLVVER